MTKRIALVAPFGTYKSFSICLEETDGEGFKATPLIYLTKSTFLTEEEYVKLVKAFQFAISPKHEVQINEETNEKN